MKRLTKHLCVISFDGLSNLDFATIQTLPHFREFLKAASYCKNVHSIYPTLTYPAHATIVTGKYPKNHGVINNTLLQPNKESPDWYWRRKHIKGDTLFDLAISKGMKVAALLWPVTAKSRIQYNIPEIFANRPWQNQITVSLLNGSPWYQIVLNHKFGHLRHGTKQPQLDDFTHQSLLYTLKRKKPELTLVHYTDLDTMRHYHGFDSREAQDALQRHDQRLGEIVNLLKEEGLYEQSTLVILGDHSSLDEDRVIRLNVLLLEQGYIRVDSEGRIKDYTAIAKSCDGSAYIYTKNPDLKDPSNYPENSKKPNESFTALSKILNQFNLKYQCFDAIYSSDEAAALGADPECAFMLEAKKGYYFIDSFKGEAVAKVNPEEVGVVPHMTKAAHGYSPFKENYTTVFMVAGKGINQGVVIDGMRLIDEGPILARLLGLELENADGQVIEDFLDV